MDSGLSGAGVGLGFGVMTGRYDEAFFEKALLWLRGLQDRICKGVEEWDGSGRFHADRWERAEGGGGESRVLQGGTVFEKAGVNFSDVRGGALPPSATARKPELAGAPFRAAGVSLVFHPWNPYVPTTHMNVRVFVAAPSGRDPVGWFGGGFDLTPFYPRREDVVGWHEAARAACAPFGKDLYPRFKKWCDEYFYLKHRGETRGVGGLFFDDFDELGPAESMEFWRSVGNAFAPAYQEIVRRRKDEPYDDRRREFQLYRRGRYVEFNLLYDRGTLFGLQSGGRTESILMSMPPLVRWQYDYRPEPGSAEAELAQFLRPQDWLGVGT